MNLSTDNLFDNGMDDIDDVVEIPQTIKNGRGVKECMHIYRAKNSVVERIGSGFIINDKGVFLSAGHNFKDTSFKYFGVYDSQQYDIERLFSEYLDPEEYNSDDTICKDLFIGKLIHFIPPSDFIPGILSREKVNVSDLTAEGYNLKYDLWSIEYSYQGIKSYYKKVYNRLDMPKGILVTDIRTAMNNVGNFYLKHPAKYAGISGGPVFFKNEVFGVFIGNVYIKSDYILDKLEEMAIR